jgi:polar amino acid transport system permease protein
VSFLDILRQLSHGVGYTLLVTLACSVTGLFSGLLIAGARQLAGANTALLLDVYTYIFRGIPVLVLLFVVYFGLPGLGLKVAPLLAMMLSLGLIAGAYLAEVFRGALGSVDPSEILAATASGLTRGQIFRFIELPQMLRFAVPGMVNEFTTVLKYSPFAYTVGLPEVTKEAMSLVATTHRGIEIYLAVGVVYFAIFRLLMVVIRWLERRCEIPGMRPA